MDRILLPLAMALASLPGFGQMDFSGDWAPVQQEDNTGNPYVGEWIGIPMSQAGRLRVEAWNASYMTLPEWQCRPHGAMYISRGPSQVRIYFNRLMGANDEAYLTVTAMLEDPSYLTQPFVRTYQFKQFPDAAGWAP